MEINTKTTKKQVKIYFKIYCNISKPYIRTESASYGKIISRKDRIFGE